MDVTPMYRHNNSCYCLDVYKRQLHTHVRLMISQVAAHAETFVISLLTVSLIGKEVNASADVKVADTAGVGEIEAFINRVSYAEMCIRDSVITIYFWEEMRISI